LKFSNPKIIPEGRFDLQFLSRLIRLPLLPFRSAIPVPIEKRENFRNLFLDIAWYGILNGSLLSFLSVYLARIEATGSQIGLISAAPAITSLIFTLPLGQWLERQPVRRSVFWSSLGQRLFYLPMVFLPVLLPAQGQIWTTIIMTLVMSIPATVVVVGFNSMFADLVPSGWRGYVSGIRNALFAIISTITNLVCGWILVALPFPDGYQVVFALGFLGAVMSSYHLYRIANQGQPGGWKHLFKKQLPLDHLNSSEEASISQSKPGLRFEIIRGPYGKILALLFFFHLFQYFPIPLFPLFTVNYLKFSDQVIGLGTATFSLIVFFGSLQLDRLSRRLGNKKLLGWGIVAMGSYPVLTGMARGVELYLIAAVAGGLAWAMVGGVLYNYLYEKIPENDRSIYLSWYNLVLNAAILIGSLSGPLIATVADLSVMLVVFGIMRVFAGAAILIWG
jgi:MFS family permease